MVSKVGISRVIKIPVGLAAKLVSLRFKRTQYVTAREIKYFDLFLCLKAITTSGHIQKFSKQFSDLLPQSKVSNFTLKYI
jgi:hypothetical protein